MLRLNSPLASLDIESTGPKPETDHIIELAVMVLDTDGARRSWCMRFKPPVSIPAEATAIHGITDEDVKDWPPFRDFAERVVAGLKGKDILTYNGWRFDLVILDQELRRAGHRLDLEGVRVIDAYGIFAKKEQRTLSDAVRKFCGRDHEGAHGAAADAEATADVLLGELAAYPDLAAMSIDDLAAFSRQSEHRLADIAGKLYYDADGILRYSFGKHKDAAVASFPSYAEWMLRCCDPPFPGSTRELLRKELGLYADEDGAISLADKEPRADAIGYTPGGSPIFMNSPSRGQR